MADCGQGWGARCPASTGKDCRCSCGGANHGKTHRATRDEAEVNNIAALAGTLPPLRWSFDEVGEVEARDQMAERLQILFIDQAEYYFVCAGCAAEYRAVQWTGGTRGAPRWREAAEEALRQHQEQHGWCEVCDPTHGFGGWDVPRS